MAEDDTDLSLTSVNLVVHEGLKRRMPEAFKLVR